MALTYIAGPPAAQAFSSRDRIIMELAGLGPDERLHLGAALLFTGAPPAPKQVADHIRTRLPALRELVLRPDPARSRWVPAEPFDADAHVHTVAVHGDILRDPALAVDAVLDRPLDPAGPLWGVWIVASAVGQGYALVYRSHHAFQDGRAAAETVDRLFGPADTAARGTGAFTVRKQGAAASLAAVLREDLLPSARRPEPVVWPPTLHPAAGTRRSAVGSYSLRRVHDLIRATGSGVSHIALAALSGALRAWHPETWRTATAPLPATFALSVRTADDPYRLLGNRGAIAVLPLPCHDPSPAGRLAALRSEASPGRLAELAGRHTALFDRMPYWCARRGLRRTIDARRVPLALADVRLRTDLSWDGNRAEAAYPIPPSVPGQPLFAAWTTYRGQLRVTFLADTGVPGLDALPGHFDDALDGLTASPAAPTAACPAS